MKMCGLGLTALLLLLCDFVVQVSTLRVDVVRQRFLDAHNSKRSSPPVPVVNMIKLVWNATLEAEAQAHAQKCVFRHSTKGYGQNLMFRAAELTLQDVDKIVTCWTDGELVKEPPSADGHMPLNHASQVLWASTATIGCSSHLCAHAEIVDHGGVITVCNYYPPGNIVGQPTYVPGPSCSQCPPSATCEDNLCVLAVSTPSASAPQSPTEGSRGNILDQVATAMAQTFGFNHRHGE